MEDLYCFMVLRPPNKLDPEDENAISLEQDSGFQTSLKAARVSDPPAVKMREVTSRLIASGEYTPELSDLDFG